ncbi:hypothetical protein TNCT_383671 [Trichonephila clavata]|uniref:Uncharacterized protein n=1 Tax=Trichonephila clavata TaxID=2740835 RepID=A0A8X6IXI5_TRICU|nr:hypothetical protein TNCT_383671 [Trichonephila clavata]
MISYSESSIIMDISPTKNSQLAAGEKLRETVAGIPAIQQTLQQEVSIRTPRPRNSFIELYWKDTEAMMRRKEGLTARPDFPTKKPDPVETVNSFSDLDQDVEQPIPITTNPSEEATVTSKPPPPIMLKIDKNYRDQITKALLRNYGTSYVNRMKDSLSCSLKISKNIRPLLTR